MIWPKDYKWKSLFLISIEFDSAINSPLFSPILWGDKKASLIRMGLKPGSTFSFSKRKKFSNYFREAFWRNNAFTRIRYDRIKFFDFVYKNVRRALEE